MWTLMEYIGGEYWISIAIVFQYYGCLAHKNSHYNSSFFHLKQRNSHWRVQNFVTQPHAIKNGSGPGSMFPGKFDDNSISMSPTMLTSTQTPVESDPNRDIACKPMDRQPEVANKGISISMPLQGNLPAPARSDSVLLHPLQRPVSDAQSNECPATTDTMNQQEELTVEGGTINISSIYSQGCILKHLKIFFYLFQFKNIDCLNFCKYMVHQLHVDYYHLQKGDPSLCWIFTEILYLRLNLLLLSY